MASSLPRFDIVCEGPADYFVIEAALVAILDGSDFVLQRIQPPESLYGGASGPFGGGWKGVRAWCESMRDTWGSFAKGRSSVIADVLIIHLDADVADENEINCAQPCPPPEATVRKLRDVLLGWMGESAVPDWVVFCIPSKDSDAWVLVALYPGDIWAATVVECRSKCGVRFLNKPEKLVRQRDGKLQKRAASYQEISDQITKKWSVITNRCGEGKRFEEEFLAAV